MINIEKRQTKSFPDKATWILSEEKFEFKFQMKMIGNEWRVVSFIGGKNGDDLYGVEWLNNKTKCKWKLTGKGKRNSNKSKEEMLDFISKCEDYLWNEYQIVFMD